MPFNDFRSSLPFSGYHRRLPPLTYPVLPAKTISPLVFTPPQKHTRWNPNDSVDNRTCLCVILTRSSVFVLCFKGVPIIDYYIISQRNNYSPSRYFRYKYLNRIGFSRKQQFVSVILVAMRLCILLVGGLLNKTDINSFLMVFIT